MSGQSDNSVLSSIKEALKPGDLRAAEKGTSGAGLSSDVRGTEYSLDGLGHRTGHQSGGVLETIASGGQHTSESNSGIGMLEKIKGAIPGSGETEYKKSGVGEAEPKNYAYEKFPGVKDHLGPVKGSAVNDNRAYARVSPLDSQGTIGHQFSSEGAIGGTAEKIGGPFSKEGAIGREFTDTGAIGGRVQDALGHGDATRKGE